MKTTFLFALLALVAVVNANDRMSSISIPKDVPEHDPNQKHVADRTYDQMTSEEFDKTVRRVAPWRKHDFKGKREPEFLSEMSSAAKSEYFEVKFNPDLTKTEKTQQLKDWAEKYEKEEEMQKFLDAKKADCDKKKEERKENYKRLGELIEKADAILDDEENTWASANQKLENLVNTEDRELAKAFRAFYPWLGEHEGGRGRHHGHRFHHGKRFGGNRVSRNIGHGAAPRHQDIGFGAEPKHHNIGRGAEPPRSNFGNANENYDPYGNQKHHKHHNKHHGF